MGVVELAEYEERLIDAQLACAMAVFVLAAAELVAAAESRSTRSLTTAECAQYLPTLDCPTK